MRRFNWISITLACGLEGCAYLHHYQLGEIDNRNPDKNRRFEIKVSEMGFNLEEAKEIAKMVSTSEKGSQAIDDIAAIISLFQMGPKTGNPVFNDKYAKNLIHQLHQTCPSGKITGVSSIREIRKYPVISGEIVKIIGYCLGKTDRKG